MTDAWVVGCAVMCCVGGLGLIGRLRVAARSGRAANPLRPLVAAAPPTRSSQIWSASPGGFEAVTR